MMNKKAFTLIELILYVTLTSIILVGIGGVVPYVLEARLQNQIILEVEEQARFLTGFLGREIRNADGINSPGVGSSGTSLSLDVLSGVDDPTIVSLSGTNVEVTRGASAAVQLLNDRVNVTSLNFRNVTKADTPGAVRVEFTLEYDNQSGRASFDYVQDFYMTAVIKKS